MDQSEPPGSQQQGLLTQALKNLHLEDWDIKPCEIEVMAHADGQPVLLGQGAYGQVQPASSALPDVRDDPTTRLSLHLSMYMCASRVFCLCITAALQHDIVKCCKGIVSLRCLLHGPGDIASCQMCC